MPHSIHLPWLKRALLISCVSLTVIFIAWLSVQIILHWRTEQQIRTAFASLPTASSTNSNCATAETIYSLLNAATRIDDDLKYWPQWMPFRQSQWVNKNAKQVANLLLEKIIMPDIACHLNAQAQQISQSHNIVYYDNPDNTLQALMTLVKKLHDFENQQRIFKNLSNHSFHHLDSEAQFLNLTSSIYQKPLPETIKLQQGIFPAALNLLEFRYPLQIPSQFKLQLTQEIEMNLDNLKIELDKKILEGPMLLEQFQQSKSLLSASEFYQWLLWIQKNIINHRLFNNVSLLQKALNYLVENDGYPATLSHVLENTFESHSLALLKQMYAPPYGAIFEQEGKTLKINPAVLKQFQALQKFDHSIEDVNQHTSKQVIYSPRIL